MGCLCLGVMVRRWRFGDSVEEFRRENKTADCEMALEFQTVYIEYPGLGGMVLKTGLSRLLEARR